MEAAMGFRFQRRIKLMPGVTLNLSKSGVTTSLGVRGARVTLGRGRVRQTVGLPGTGISHTAINRVAASSKTTRVTSQAAPARPRFSLVAVVVGALLWFLVAVGGALAGWAGLVDALGIAPEGVPSMALGWLLMGLALASGAWCLWRYVRVTLLAAPDDAGLAAPAFVVTHEGRDAPVRASGAFVSPDDSDEHALAWSGVDHGPLPIQQLTGAQGSCLADASQNGARLTPHADGGYAPVGSRWPHHTRTVTTLARHGFLVQAAGDYVITDKGLQAFETLPWRG